MRSIGVAAVVVALFTLATARDAHASVHTGRTACGAWKVTLTPDTNQMSATFCDGTIEVRGTLATITNLTFTAGSKRYELSASVPAPDPRQRATVEELVRNVDRLRLVADMLASSDDPSIAERLLNAKTTWTESTNRTRGAGHDVGCTDVTEIVETMGTAAYLDHESSLSYARYHVPAHCTVVVDGTVDVGELTVDGMLIRLGGGIKADALGGGARPIGIGRIFVTGSVEAQRIRLVKSVKLSATGGVSTDSLALDEGFVSADGLVRFRRGDLSHGSRLTAESIELEELTMASSAVATAVTYLGTRRAMGVGGGVPVPAKLTITDGGTASSSGDLHAEQITAKGGGTVKAARIRTTTIVATLGGLVRGSERIEAVSAVIAADARLSGGHATVRTVDVVRGSVNVGILESDQVDGRDAGIRVRQRMTVRTGAATVTTKGGALVVSTQALDPDDPANDPTRDPPVEPEGPPAFAACLATPAGLDVTTLTVDGTDVSVRHSKLTTLRAKGGRYRPIRAPAVRDVPRATMCLEVSGEGTFDGTFVAASRLYVGLARGKILGKAELAADEGGELPRTGEIHINTEDHPLATGASFGGYGGTSGNLGATNFQLAQAPLDDPRSFREGGIGGQGGDAEAITNGFAAAFPGAGVIRIVATDLVLDGTVHADGRTFPDGVNGAGGGSGGSVVLALTGNLSGKGLVTAHGGDGGWSRRGATGGGGSGGRIRIEHESRTGWRGRVLAWGGLGGRHDRSLIAGTGTVVPWSDWRNHGGPGTVYWKPATGTAQVVVEGPPLVRGKHRGVGFVTGDLTGDEIVIKNAFVVADALQATKLTIAAGGVLTADEPRLRLEWPPARGFFSSDYPDALQVGWGGIAQIGYTAALWAEPLEESLAVKLTGDLVIEKGGGLVMTGLGGYAQHQTIGNGAFNNRAGGSHGGHGGTGRYSGTANLGRVSDASGDALEPKTPGEGGWGDADWNGGRPHAIGSLGGAGGGVLRVTVGGATTIDGQLGSDGAPGQTFYDAYNFECGTGGGAGGSVWLTTRTLAGRGTISADGGAGTASPKVGAFGGGGGGGRVRIDTETAVAATWRGSVRALGGAGGAIGGRVPSPPRGAAPYQFTARFHDPRYDGGPGTVYWKPADAPGTLVIDGTRGGRGTGLLAGPLPDDRVGTVELRGATVMAYTPIATVRLVLARGAVLRGFDRRVRTLYLADPALPVDAITLGPSAFPTDLSLTIAGDITIDRTSRIDMSGIGEYGQQACVQSCSWANHAGGSHGGAGGAGLGASSAQPGEPSPTRGDANQPTASGEGGWGGSAAKPTELGFDPCTSGGSGGGALSLKVGGTLALDGRIVADGAGALPRTRCPRLHDAGGGGAGGSVLVQATTFSGRGVVSAAGGRGVANAPSAQTPGVGGGGGGGRIAISATTCSFRGATSVAGGGSEAGHGAREDAHRGGAGTITGSCAR